jgi:hypothetical protein
MEIKTFENGIFSEHIVVPSQIYSQPFFEKTTGHR